jgi:hypothetical protein
MKRTTLPLLLLLCTAALALVGCGGGDTASSAESAMSNAESVAESVSESVIGGGAAVCDQATLDAWVAAYGEDAEIGGATLPQAEFACADGWAVIFPTVGTNNADDAFTETIVLQAEGPIWALMDRTKVCGASEAESEVPATLYQDACQTN